MKGMTIGTLASSAGINRETIRYYEKRGLIQSPPRRLNGYREYPEKTVARIRFIRRAKRLGFTLKEIRELLSLRVDPQATCGDVKHRTEQKVAEIEKKILRLQSMKKALQILAASCTGNGPSSVCPFLEALDMGPWRGGNSSYD